MSARPAPFDPFACPLDGVNFVEASAGTGKTYSLSWIAARLVIERDVPIDGLLAVTFTNAATAELKTAVHARLATALGALEGRFATAGERERDYAMALPDRELAAYRARTALAEIDRASLSSIHGFCLRVLQERAFETGVPFEASLVEDDDGFARQVADDFWALETYETSLERARELREAAWSPDRVRRIVGLLWRNPEVAIVHSGDALSRDVETRLVAFAAEAAERRRRISYGLSFNDLLCELDRALADGARGAALVEALRDRYSAVLIDELQDTNAVQWRIFQRAFLDGGSPFFAFGDPKQAIYGFRGGDVYAYLGAVERSDARRWTLNVNYRSDEGVVRGVNALFTGAEDPFRSGGRIEFRPASARPEAVGVAGCLEGGAAVAPVRIILGARGSASDLARLVAEDVAGLLASDTRLAPARRVAAADVAILTRTNIQIARLAEALQRVGIEASTAGDASVFATDEARTLAALLEGVAAPDDAASLATALATPLFDIDTRTLRDVARGAPPFPMWKRRMEALARAFDGGGPVGLVRAAFALGPDGDAPPVAARLFERAGGARLASRLRHTAELLQRGEPALGRDPAEAARQLRERSAASGKPPEEEQIRPSGDGDAVLLMTAHKAKGLEFPIVYMPYFSAASGRRKERRKDEFEPTEFHDPGHGFAASADLALHPDAERAALASEEREGEEMRLFYVAATRARHLLKIVWSPPAAGAPGPVAALVRRFAPAGFDGDADEAALEGLVDVARGAISIERFGSRPAPAAGDPAERAAAPIPEAARVRIPACETDASFTSLVSATESFDEEDAEAPDAAVGSARVPLCDFPAGRSAGLFFHSLLERLDFPSADTAGAAAISRDLLPRHGLDSAPWAAAAADAAIAAIDAELGGEAPALRLVDRRSRMDELRFLFPAARATTPVSASALANALRAGGSGGFPTRCASRAEDLSFQAFSGFATGAVDLVFAHGGRHFVADYKTNHLGPRFEDYGAAALEREMLRHHYYLQYHLYSLALHRHLRLRLPGYDYDAHFGGVRYLFLRGMAPGSTSGVFAARPARSVVEALDDLFAGEEKRTP